MSLHSKISEIDTSEEIEEITVSSEMFFDLVDIFRLNTYLINHIQEEKDEDAHSVLLAIFETLERLQSKEYE